MRPNLRSITLLGTAATMLTFAGSAFGQTAQDLAAAEQLFREAKALMQAKDYTKACTMFAESARLDSQPGTLLNLGLCYEAQHKTASAWGAFSQAAIEATRKGQPERATFGKEHAAELEPKLSQVRILVESPTAGETITLDGRAIGEGSLVTALPMDPGQHAIEASAPGKKTAKQSFTVAEGPSTSEVSVPALVDLPPEPPRVFLAPESGGPSRRTVGFIVGGVGVAGLATGTVFGLMYLSKADDNNKQCVGDPAATDGALCTPDQLSSAKGLQSDAKTFSAVSAVGLGVGVVGLALGTYLVLTSRKPADAPKSASAVRVIPNVGDTRGVSVVGVF